MLITVNGKESTCIDDQVIIKLLNFYPEEGLIERSVFSKAFHAQRIEIRDLMNECDKILLPWQMFFLKLNKLDKALKHIEEQRKHKVSAKLLSKRKGQGNITSKRIIDRLIRQQNFLIQEANFGLNSYVGYLSNKTVSGAASLMMAYFDIDRISYLNLTKEKTLEFLIEKLANKKINVCRGVLNNKILPNPRVVKNDLYKNTSGFAINDDSVPFIFLPSEINDDEVVGRQIYTLIYLTVVIGLNKFNYYLEKNFRVMKLDANNMDSKIHAITSQFLVPDDELYEYKKVPITLDIRDELSQKFKVTPSSICTILKLRGFINQDQYEELMPDSLIAINNNNNHRRNPKLKTSIKKFCGKLVFDQICFGLRSGQLKNTNAQYLLFGVIDKNRFQKFRTEIEA